MTQPGIASVSTLLRRSAHRAAANWPTAADAQAPGRVWALVCRSPFHFGTSSQASHLPSNPKPHLASQPRQRQDAAMPPAPSSTTQRLRHFIAQRMRMSHVYQPLMLMELLGQRVAGQQPVQPRQRTSPAASWGKTSPRSTTPPSASSEWWAGCSPAMASRVMRRGAFPCGQPRTQQQGATTPGNVSRSTDLQSPGSEPAATDHRSQEPAQHQDQSTDAR